MILVHKPMAPHFALPAVVNSHHRRHPSAPPAVVVQPTRTPGLLSLSKPAHVQQRQVQRPSPRTKQVAPTSPVLKAQPKAAVQVQQPAPHNNRGRSQNKPKDKPTRSSSASARGSRRAHGRQPSPPSNLSNPSQAEDSDSLPSSNQFDPFLDHDDHHPKPPPPTIATRPSGKLASRRQHKDDSDLPSSSGPARKQPPTASPNMPISRSVPALSYLSSSRPPAKARKHASDAVPVFPICDDMTEAGDLSDHDESMDVPSTPTRPRIPRHAASDKRTLRLPSLKSVVYDEGPKTAPLSSTTGPYGGQSVFPFPRTSPGSTPTKKGLRGRKHKRSPSEGVFNMSSSSDSDSPSTNQKEKRHSTEELLGLFGLPVGGAASAPLTPPRKRLSTTRTGTRPIPIVPAVEEEKDGYFAGSMFQNSPSPEDLPPPDF